MDFLENDFNKESFNCLEDEILTVSFSCQRCCQPLRIHKTFDIISNLNNYFDDENDNDIKNNYKTVKNLSFVNESNSNVNDFLLVEGTTANLNFCNDNVQNSFSSLFKKKNSKKINNKPPLDDLNYNLNVTSRLSDLLSDQSNINHPLCEECADYIIEQMDNQLKTLEDEFKVYKEFLENLEKTQPNKTSEEDMKELNNKIKNLEKEEKELLNNLEKTIKNKQEIEFKIKKQLENIDKTNEEINNSWCEYNYFKKKLFDCEDELQSLDNQLQYVETHLDKVKSTNIFAATFHIWHDGHFGTINGLRLGRLPTIYVEWSEINAAWGQVVLLLYSLAKTINLEFKHYKLVPYGNHSFIQCLEQKSRKLPLFCSGGYRFMWDSKYDQAMSAFLDCLQQFQEEIEKENTDFYLPYKIKNGKIEDQSKHFYSIKICRNSEEEWTKALKFMLTDLKWIITWVVIQSSLK